MDTGAISKETAHLYGNPLFAMPEAGALVQYDSLEGRPDMCSNLASEASFTDSAPLEQRKTALASYDQLHRNSHQYAWLHTSTRDGEPTYEAIDHSPAPAASNPN